MVGKRHQWGERRRDGRNAKTAPGGEKGNHMADENSLSDILCGHINIFTDASFDNSKTKEAWHSYAAFQGKKPWKRGCFYSEGYSSANAEMYAILLALRSLPLSKSSKVNIFTDNFESWNWLYVKVPMMVCMNQWDEKIPELAADIITLILKKKLSVRIYAIKAHAKQINTLACKAGIYFMKTNHVMADLENLKWISEQNNIADQLGRSKTSFETAEAPSQKMVNLGNVFSKKDIPLYLYLMGKLEKNPAGSMFSLEAVRSSLKAAAAVTQRGDFVRIARCKNAAQARLQRVRDKWNELCRLTGAVILIAAAAWTLLKWLRRK